MSIKSAQKSDFYVVKEITHTTINEIYYSIIKQSEKPGFGEVKK